MIEITEKGVFTELYTTEGYLHKIGDKNYSKIRRACIFAPDSVENYEEIYFENYDAILLEQYKREEYSKRLSEAIHQRYSLDDEIALMANVNSAELLSDEDTANKVAEEYTEYQTYRSECKTRIRAEIDAITEIPKDPMELENPSLSDTVITES